MYSGDEYYGDEITSGSDEWLDCDDCYPFDCSCPECNCEYPSDRCEAM